MDNLVVFQPKAAVDAEANLRGFIDLCRNELTVFGSDLPFDENIWDISNSINLIILKVMETSGID